MRSIGFDLYSSQHQEDLRPHVHGGGRKVPCQVQLCNWHVRLHFSCQGQHYIVSAGSCSSSCFYTLNVHRLF